jgi:predicted phosphohydrolase
MIYFQMMTRGVVHKKIKQVCNIVVRNWCFMVTKWQIMCDLRPISLCNVINKIILKVLANCLKPLMSNFISQEHYAFVENKSIIDNVSKELDGVDWKKAIFGHLRDKVWKRIQQWS